MSWVCVGRNLAAAVAILASGAAWAQDRTVLSDAAMGAVTAGGIFGIAAGGSFAEAQQVGAGKASISQTTVNTVKNSNTGFSASSRVRATASASGKGLSGASIIGASAVAAAQVPPPP